MNTLPLSTPQSTPSDVRHDWTLAEIEQLFMLPFSDLLFRAQTIHRRYFDPNKVQLSTLLSIKTGGCPEDCKYCPQSAHYDTGVQADGLLSKQDIVADARRAKSTGATRFCMGAAWRAPKDRDIATICSILPEIKSLGLETCLTLGMLSPHQAQHLKTAGLDYYNHNIDTSEDFYGEIITTRSYQDRLDTLHHVREAGLKVCCGGIVGMGESRADRAGMLQVLATLPEHPESVPINLLVRIEGTPLEDVDPVDSFEFVRMIAAARILMPNSHVRLSAGREEMSPETQALCFLAGANSIFYGERLLTAPNPQNDKDRALFQVLGITPV